MKKVITILALIPTLCFGQWNQLGADIDGQAANEQSGTAISLNAAGTILINSAPRAMDAGIMKGKARVFEWNGTSWLQKGSDLVGTSQGDVFGDAVSISSNGNIIAVGAPGFSNPSSPPGYTRVYEWNGSNYIQKGTDIIGEANGNSAGTAVSLSADGNTIAIGAGLNSNANGSFAGHCRVYTWNGSSWVQKGADIDGEAAQDFFGNAVGIDASGNIVAIGAAANDGAGTNFGHVRVFEWNGTSWVQKGADIDGENSVKSFGSTLSLSGDGTTFIASGHSGSNGSAGSIKMFTWNGTNWAQKGLTLSGDTGSDFFGTSVDINGNGSMIIAGTTGTTGYARVFEFIGSAWIQQGADLVGEANFDQFGRSSSINDNGSIVAAGTPGNDGNGTSAGHVRVFENLSLCAPEAGFSANGTEFSFAFTSTATNADSVSYDFGDGTTSTAPNPTHVYAAAGTYTVCQIAYGSCRNDTSCTTVDAICNTPVAGFTTASNELAITLTSTATNADSIFYTYGDGTTGTDATHTYALPGTYQVCQIATRPCGSDTLCQSVTVSCAPASSEFSFQVNTFSSVTFTSGATNADSIRFVYGTTAFSTSSPWTYDFGASGTFTVSLIAYNKCGNDTTTIEVTVIGTSISDLLDVSSLLLFPNPAGREVTLSFTLHKAAELHVGMVDMQGRAVFSQAYDRAAGAFQTNISLPDLATGVYLVQIRVDDALVTRKLRVE